MTNSSRMTYKAGILTVSDRASLDANFDKSGPFLKEYLGKNNYSVEQQHIVPDELHDIQKVIEQWTELGLDLIIITGGTGFAKRDKTPEAVKPLLTRETPGITHLLLQSSINITPFAALSRPVTGIRDNTLIVTLPGSLKACKENMEAIINVLPHGLDLLLDKDVTKAHEAIQSASSSSSGGGHHHKGHNCVHRHDAAGHPSQTGRTVPLGTPVSGRARSSPYALLPVTQALEIISQHAQCLNTVIMPFSQFLPSYVLSEDVQSTEPVPGYRASIVDGYAVYAEDGPGTYPIESVALASASAGQTTLTRGKIARVATGGMIPDGANAIIMIEDTKLVTSSESGEEIDIEILATCTPGENIREIGSDCAIGETIGFAGQRISTVGGDLGALASGGVRHVKVYRKPRVGVVSTGNEVADALTVEKLKPGQVRDTNRLTLLSAIQLAGFEPVDLGIIEDSVEKLEEGLSEALEQVDVLITTGGVSMGESDFMKPILEQKLGATIHFGRVMMKPGKPTTFATIPQGKRTPKLIFALPGNPVSAIVTFHLFVVSALKKMAGYSKYENVVVPVKITHSISLDPRPEYHRVQIIVSPTEGLTATSTGKQQSSRLLSMLEANGLLQLPQLTEDKKEMKAGEIVPCIVIGPLHPAI